MSELQENWLTYLWQGGFLLILWEVIRRPLAKVLQLTWNLLTRTVLLFRRRVVYPVSLRVAQFRHGERVSNIEITTYDEYRGLSEEDQRLMLMLESHKVLPLLMAHTYEKSDWQIEAEEKANKAVTTQSVFTRNGERLQCWNCAFFVVDLENINGSFRRNTLKGHCYSESPSKETYLKGFCRHHSATKGYLKSKVGIYNIAPVDS